ncbi:MAG TPA: sigma-70 family RNA polymerase sigma factor [Herpetosiphonaceae bacterium]|nr:sigma-70 family RNA polymerase sigma factor [Herpetosiphonaceae bacterium]
MADLHLVHMRWTHLRQRYRWTLVDDEMAFVGEVGAHLDAAGGLSQDPPKAIDVAIHQRYNERLYVALKQGLLHLDQDSVVATFNRAHEEVRQMVAGVVRARGFPPDQADEVSQDISLHIVTHLDSIRQPASLTAWLLWWVRAALKKLTDARTAAPLDESADEQRPDPGPPLAERVERRDNARQLKRLLKRVLSDFQYQLIVLHVLNQDSAPEVAAALGVRVSKVHVEKSRALRRIKNDPELRRFLGLPDSTED